MTNQEVFFNILTFGWNKEKTNFYFGLEEVGHCQKIHKSIFPKDIESIFVTPRSNTIYHGKRTTINVRQRLLRGRGKIKNEVTEPVLSFCKMDRTYQCQIGKAVHHLRHSKLLSP